MDGLRRLYIYLFRKTKRDVKMAIRNSKILHCLKNRVDTSSRKSINEVGMKYLPKITRMTSMQSNVMLKIKSNYDDDE
jgi:hypothetical protein